jgi:threonine/homoserine/homoserine lactone efflux protein
VRARFGILGVSMSIEVWTIYVAAVLAMMSTPGPSHLLMLSNSLTHGFRPSLATAAGDLTANSLQMLAAGLGLAALLATFGNALLVIKWLGFAYLIWLGIRMILNAGKTGTAEHEYARTSWKALWLQGFLTSAVNPKAIVFFAALFPQFISIGAPFWNQFVVLSVTYLVLDGLFLTAYGFGADRIGSRLSGGAGPAVERLGGSFLIGAAILLGLKTIKESL